MIARAPLLGASKEEGAAPSAAPLWPNLTYLLAREQWKDVADSFPSAAASKEAAAWVRGQLSSLVGAICTAVLGRFA
jgi:hypothetical protein